MRLSLAVERCKMRLPATSPALAPLSLLLLLLVAVGPAASQTPVFFTYPDNVSAPLGTTVELVCEADQPALVWRINALQIRPRPLIDNLVNQGFLVEVGEIERTARGNRITIIIPATVAVNDSVAIIVCQAGPTDFDLSDGADISFSVFGLPLAPGEVEVRENTALQLQLSWSPPFSLPGENISYFLLVQDVTSGLNQTLSPLSLTAFTHHLPLDQALHCHHFIFSVFSLNQVGLSLNSSSTDPLLHPSGPGPLGEIETEVSHNSTQSAGSIAVLHLTFQRPTTCFPLNYTISLREEESGNQSTFHTTSSGSGMETIQVPGLQENTHYSATLSASNHFSFSASDPVQASLTPFVTSGLQSVSVLQYQNGSVRISCGFASGSVATGCEVSLSLDTTITVEVEVYRSEGALEAVRVSSIAGIPSSVEGRELGTSAPLVISGRLSSEGDLEPIDPFEPCEDGEFHCPGDSFCQPNVFLCDSYDDCQDGFDEKNCSKVEISSPTELSVKEGDVETFEICLTVTEAADGHFFKEYPVQAHTSSARNGTDFIFYNQTILFNGSYYDGDSVCVGVTVAAHTDGIVEGTEEFIIFIQDQLDYLIFVYIIDSDYLKVGFSQESYSVAESFGRAEVTVRILPNETGNVPCIGAPFGLRITSADVTAIGGQDYQSVLATVYFRPDHPPYVVVQIDILDDSLSEENEQLTIQLKSYDLSVILVNDIAEIVIIDNDAPLCPDLVNPTDGSVQYTGLTPGSVATYTCNDGYQAVGEVTKTCETDGTWTGDPPVCENEECTVELVGDIVVQGNSASFSFRGVGSLITRYICKVDGVIQPDCSSSLTGLSPGQHRLRVVPVGCEVNRGVTFRFAV